MKGEWTFSPSFAYSTRKIVVKKKKKNDVSMTGGKEESHQTEIFARILSQIHRCNKLRVTRACTRLVPAPPPKEREGLVENVAGEKRERRKVARG